MNKSTQMATLCNSELKQHFDQHCVQSYTANGTVRKNIYVVTKPMHVFKKVFGDCGVHVIANLIIPVGAFVQASTDVFAVRCDSGHSDAFMNARIRKMRASEAHVHSLVKQRSQQHVGDAYSGWDPFFKYTVGTTVKPRYVFSLANKQCDYGIHFFVNLDDAMKWNW